MDYLPERKRELPIQVVHKQEKVKNFRRYLADSNVVLAFVKCNCLSDLDLLALRDCKPWPENPTDYLKDFFGNYRDPKWDDVEALEKNIEDIQSNQIPNLEAKIQDLEFKLKTQRKRNFLANCFKQLDADGSKLVGYKLLVMRLSGFPKFDLDTKLNSEQFVTFVMSLIGPLPGPEQPAGSERASPSESGSQKKLEEEKDVADQEP